MAKRQSLGRGLNALIPDVSRETSPATPDAQTALTPAVTAKVGAESGGVADVTSEIEVRASGPSGGPDRAASQADANPFEVAGLTLMELPIDQIVPNSVQPRQHFDEEALTELVHSITEIGLLQPIVVRPAEVGYELIAGERRLRASKLAGLNTIAALVRQTADEQMLRDALLENLHRSQLTALEEAAAYHQLLEDFGCTQEELATRLGRSRPQISNTLRLLNLPASVQRRVAAGVLSAGHARALLGLKDADAIEKLAARIVAEGLSVRSVEEIVSVGLGDKPKSNKTAKAKGVISAPGLAELGERMSARLDTRVTLSVGQKRGKVTIEFATLEDLRRIVEIVDPPTRGMFGEPLL